jgi:transcriptional regulator of arginine metabolism
MKILEIIENNPIATQEELSEKLKKEGFNVTQATVSRDIKELRLIKVPWDDNYKYAQPENAPAVISEKFVRLFRESITGIDYSENLIVIKTLSGTANAAAAAIDSLNWNEILGTVAGDDTILVIVKNKQQVEEIIKRFYKLM